MRFLYVFLLLICLDSYSQSNPSVGEIYDFEVGDLFQYRGETIPISGPPSFGQTFIYDKWFSAENDTVFYEV